MSHAVIPAPMRFDVGAEREFVFRPGTAVAYAGTGIAPVAERFCSQVMRRTGLSLRPRAGDPPPGDPHVRIELAAGFDPRTLPAPTGLSPAGDTPRDERHELAIDAGKVVVRAAEPAGVARGLTTLIQLRATTPAGGTGEIRVPGARILDAPRYAWRGLSLDVARTFFTAGEIRRVIDMLELYKLNVLHLHLTDDQAWRLPVGRPAGSPEPDGPFFSDQDLRDLVSYAADRFITVVPEVDTPGHVSALLRLHPELSTGRNEVEHESPSGRKRRAAWLDPELPATFGLIGQVLAGLAAIFPGPYLHIGADEPYGMPHELYASYVRQVRRCVRAVGKRPLGWQESARAGLGPDDVIQYWISDIALSPSLPPRARARMDADLALSRRDVEMAVAASVPVIVSPASHCYLDVPYAGPPADRAEADRQGRLGLPVYAPQTVAEAFGWEPGEALGAGGQAQVAGVEAAIWAETISGFDDLSFLLLPRLAGVAHKAWSQPQLSSWPGHRDRLARHRQLWAHDDLAHFRAFAR